MNYYTKSIFDIKQAWDDFCLNNGSCWLFHKSMIFFDNPETNHSFGLFYGDKLIAICPLILEQKQGGVDFVSIFSLFGLSLPCPVVSESVELDSKFYKKIEEQVFLKIDEIAKKTRAVKIAYNLFPEVVKIQQANRLLKHGFLDVSFKCLVIDLSNSEDDLLKNLSKGHRSNIKKEYSDIKFKVDSISANPLSEQEFSMLAKEAEEFGDEEISFLYSLYNQNNLEVHSIWNDTGRMGVALFFKCKGIAQYFEASKSGTTDYPVHHLILWNAIKSFKKQMLFYLNLGIITYSSQIHYVLQEKQKAIRVFKRGFGGKVFPFYIGEKYYSRSFFVFEQMNRMKKYSEMVIDHE